MNTTQMVRPVVEGLVAVLGSGGNGVALQGILEAAHSHTSLAANNSGMQGLQTAAVRGGWSRLMAGDTSCLTVLDNQVAFKAASANDAPIISFSTVGPNGSIETGADVSKWVEIIHTLLNSGVRYLVLFGGDFSLAMQRSLQQAIETVVEAGGERLYFGCLVKSIDNDSIALRGVESSIGFYSAAHQISNELRCLNRDAQMSDGTVYAVVTHGNAHGWLAEAACRLADLPMFFAPEYFEGFPVDLQFVSDCILGAFLKGYIAPSRRQHLTVVVAEGCSETLLGEEFVSGNMRANRARLVTRLEQSMARTFDACTFTGIQKIKCRSQQKGYSGRGARLELIDEQMVHVQTTELLRRLFAGESNLVVTGTGENVDVRTLDEAFANGSGPKQHTRPLDVRLSAVNAHWNRGATYRLTPADLTDDNVRRFAELMDTSTEEVLRSLTPVAAWGAQRFN